MHIDHQTYKCKAPVFWKKDVCVWILSLVITYIVGVMLQLHING